MNRREFVTGGIASAAGLCLLFNRSFSQTVPGIELFLFLDWSDSMCQNFPDGRPNYLIQRNGHLSALGDIEIQKRLIEVRAFVRVVLWAGSTLEIVPIFAGRMGEAADVYRLLKAISKRVPDHSSPTGLTDHLTPLAYAESVPLASRRRIIDISTDQAIENGWITNLCRGQRDKLNSKMATEINVLAVGVNERGIENLSKNLLTPKGFIMKINGWEEYIPAIKRKLEKELGVV